jgi:hypothetical protein
MPVYGSTEEKQTDVALGVIAAVGAAGATDYLATHKVFY